MNIAQSIMHLHPNADPTQDFIVQDDGDGAYIAEWNLPGTQPTEAQLLAAWEIIKDLPPPKTAQQKKIDELTAENASATNSIIELWEVLIPLLP